MTNGWLNELSRDPFYPWDMPTLRRNYGEPLQVIITECVFSWKHHTAVHQWKIFIMLLHYFRRRQSPVLTSFVYRKTGWSSRRTDSPTWMALTATPENRWWLVRLPGSPLYSSACGCAMERTASLSKTSCISCFFSFKTSCSCLNKSLLACNALLPVSS